MIAGKTDNSWTEREEDLERYWRRRYFNLLTDLGIEINRQQDIITSQARRLKHLERENWQLRQGRRKRL